MERVILLDADVPIYQFAAVNQVNVTWDDDGETTSLCMPFDYVCGQLDAHLEELQNHLEADRLIVCLSEPDPAKNWRKQILPSYKENRKTTKSPEYRQPLSDYLERNYECFKRPTLEGDDVMGILATNSKVIPGKKVIVSIDKDMETIPTRTKKGVSVNFLYNPTKDRKPRRVTEEQADWYWMYQTLIGDTTDGYKGCPRVGPVKAKEILGPPEEGHLSLWWDLVVDTYEAAKYKGESLELGIEDALVQARVARICRAEDYDFVNKRAIPWDY